MSRTALPRALTLTALRPGLRAPQALRARGPRTRSAHRHLQGHHYSAGLAETLLAFAPSTDSHGARATAALGRFGWSRRAARRGRTPRARTAGRRYAP